MKMISKKEKIERRRTIDFSALWPGVGAEGTFSFKSKAFSTTIRSLILDPWSLILEDDPTGDEVQAIEFQGSIYCVGGQVWLPDGTLQRSTFRNIFLQISQHVRRIFCGLSEGYFWEYGDLGTILSRVLEFCKLLTRNHANSTNFCKLCFHFWKKVQTIDLFFEICANVKRFEKWQHSGMT